MDFAELDRGRVGLFDTSPTGATLSGDQQEDLLVFYHGFDHHLYALDGEATGGFRTRFVDISHLAPAAAMRFGIEAFVAWTGTDGNQSLNFARLGDLPTF